MKVLAFLGSPRKGGNSEVLMQAVLRGVAAAGAEIETVRLCALKINGCLNCGGCDDTGECVVDDDMVPLYGKIIRADRLILASPIFFYGITAQAKAFVDRCQALWNRKKLLQEKGQWRDDPDRLGYFVSVAATRGKRVFEGAILTMRYGYDAMGFHYGGEYLFRGAEFKGDMAGYTGELQHAEEAGREFAERRGGE